MIRSEFLGRKPKAKGRGYFQPMVIYRNPDEERKDSVLRYVGNRVLYSNKNFLCGIVGLTGVGKSWYTLSLCEKYSKLYNIPFDPEIHVISSLKELLLLITSKDVDKKIQFGSVIMFDEPQIEGSAQSWQSEMNQALRQLISTFRNQRLVVFFVTPYLEMIDKTSRILFHGEFQVLGYDKNTGITRSKPRFLEYIKKIQDFYRKRLIVQYKTSDKIAMNITKINFWGVSKASQATIDIYEAKKKKFTDDLNKKLLSTIEMNEKIREGRDKSEELFKIKELYEQFGEDYLKILKEMPHLAPYTVEKYLYFIKKSLKGVNKPRI